MEAIFMHSEFKSRKMAFIITIQIILVENEEEKTEEGSDTVQGVRL